MSEDYYYIRSLYKFQKISFKKSSKKPKIYEYYLFHLPKIILWNKKYNLLKFSMLYSKIKLTNGFKQKIDDIFLINILPLNKYIKYIIKLGWNWSFLTIKEYNLIVLLSDFFNKMENIHLKKILNDSDFFKMEESFFKLIKNKEYPDIIINSLKEIFKNFNFETFEKKDDSNDMLVKLYFLFNVEEQYMTIFDLIIGFNMVYSKRSLNWNDIMRGDNQENLMTGFYDCPEEVFDEIYKQIENIIMKNEKLNLEKKEIEWIKDYSEIKDSNNPEKIVDFYRSIQGDWKIDSLDVFNAFFNLIEGLLNIIDKILFGEWSIMGKNEKISNKKVLDRSLFETIYQKINNNYKNVKMHHVSKSMVKVTIFDFLNTYDLENKIDETQRYLFIKLEETLPLLKEFATKLNKIMIDDLFIIKKNEINKFMIVNPIELRGKSVQQGVYYFIELLIQICGYFKEKVTISEIEYLKKINDSIQKNQESLKKIGDVNHQIERIILEKHKKKSN